MSFFLAGLSRHQSSSRGKRGRSSDLPFLFHPGVQQAPALLQDSIYRVSSLLMPWRTMRVHFVLVILPVPLRPAAPCFPRWGWVTARTVSPGRRFSGAFLSRNSPSAQSSVLIFLLPPSDPSSRACRAVRNVAAVCNNTAWPFPLKGDSRVQRVNGFLLFSPCSFLVLSFSSFFHHGIKEIPKWMTSSKSVDRKSVV